MKNKGAKAPTNKRQEDLPNFWPKTSNRKEVPNEHLKSSLHHRSVDLDREVLAEQPTERRVGELMLPENKLIPMEDFVEK